MGLVLLLGLGATAFATFFLDRAGRRLDAERFAAATHQLLQEVQTRIEAYERGLAVLQGYFDDVPRPSERAWRNRLELLDLPVNYSALLEVGYAEFVSKGPTSALCPTLPDHLAWMRQQAGPDYTISPDNPDTHCLPITHVWTAPNLEAPPRGRNVAAIDDAYRRAMVAFGTGRPQSTSATRAFSRRAGREVAGFRFVFPVFSNQRATLKPNSADSAQGILFATVHADQLLQSIFEERTMEVTLELFDGPDPSAAHRLNESFPGRTSTTDRRGVAPAFETVQTMAHYGAKWALRFRSLPAFERRSPRRQARLAAASGTLLSLLLASIVWSQERARHLQAGISAELRQSRDALRQALAERERLSRDLHDGTVQSIYALGLQLEHIRKLQREDPAEAQSELAAARDEVNAVILDLRRFLLSLEPELLEGRRLDEALSGLVARLQRTTHIGLVLEAPHPVGHLSPAQAVHVLNIAREAVSNSIRHARAHTIHITLQRHPGHIELTVSDDGIGFEPGAVGDRGQGLANLRARAAELGATLTLDSAPDRGTHVRLQLPAG